MNAIVRGAGREGGEGRREGGRRGREVRRERGGKVREEGDSGRGGVTGREGGKEGVWEQGMEREGRIVYSAKGEKGSRG